MRKFLVKINGSSEFEMDEYSDGLRKCREILDGKSNSIQIVRTSFGLEIVFPKDKIEIKGVKKEWISRR